MVCPLELSKFHGANPTDTETNLATIHMGVAPNGGGFTHKTLVALRMPLEKKSENDSRNITNHTPSAAGRMSLSTQGLTSTICRMPGMEARAHDRTTLSRTGTSRWAGHCPSYAIWHSSHPDDRQHKVRGHQHVEHDLGEISIVDRSTPTKHGNREGQGITGMTVGRKTSRSSTLWWRNAGRPLTEEFGHYIEQTQNVEIK